MANILYTCLKLLRGQPPTTYRYFFFTKITSKFLPVWCFVQCVMFIGLESNWHVIKYTYSNSTGNCPNFKSIQPIPISVAFSQMHSSPDLSNLGLRQSSQSCNGCIGSIGSAVLRVGLGWERTATGRELYDTSRWSFWFWFGSFVDVFSVTVNWNHL